MTPAEFHPLAEEEYLEQAAYYERGRKGGGRRFLDALDSTISQIQRDPESGKDDEDGLQKIVLHNNYPLNLYYYVDPGLLYIVAVAHHSRAPGYWRERL